MCNLIVSASILLTTGSRTGERKDAPIEVHFSERDHMHIPGFTLRSAVAIAALALTGSAFAAGQDGQASQTVSKDPVTGKVRNATAAEAKQLNDLRAADIAAQKAARKAAGLPAAGVVRLQQNGIAAAYVD